MRTREDQAGWVRGLPAMRRESPGSKGSLQVRAYKGRPFYEARWRDLNRVQRRKRLGPAWVELDADGKWVPRRGRVRKGQLDERRAYLLMAQVIEEHEERARREAPERSDALFEEAAAAWLEHLGTEKRVKPSTLLNYGILLAQPEAQNAEGADHAGLRGTPAVRHRRHRCPDLPRAPRSRGPLSPHREHPSPGSARDLRARAPRGDLRPSRQPGGRDLQATRRRAEPGRDLRARGDPLDRRGGAGGPAPAALRLSPVGLQRRDRARVAADQRAGRLALRHRRDHRAADRRARGAALARRRPRGRLPHGLAGDLRRPGDEPQVAALAGRAARPAGPARSSNACAAAGTSSAARTTSSAVPTAGRSTAPL